MSITLRYLSILDDLPNEIVKECVWQYLSPFVKVWLNKSYYEKYHYCVKYYIPENLQDSYVRSMIRKDNSFIIERLLYENFNDWIKTLRYPYKNYIFNNYVFFLSHFAVENTSTKSYNIINKYLRLSGYEKKWHKKNSIKYIRWSN